MARLSVRASAWLLPAATFVAAVLLGLAACDSSTAFIVASFLCALTGVLVGGLRFIGRGPAQETAGQLLKASLAALALAVPAAVGSFTAMIVVAVVHCD